jgi:hypothetical protein
LASAIANCLGCRQSSIKRLMARLRALPKDAIPKRKKGFGCPAAIKSHALKILERYLKKIHA